MRRSAVLLLSAAVVASTIAGTANEGAAVGFAPGTTRRVSVNTARQPQNGVVQSGVLAANGRYVAFTSSASNLVPGVAGVHVYRHDRMSGVTELVTLAAGGGPAALGGFASSVSADGRYVAFASRSSDLVVGDVNGVADVFVRDMQAGLTVLASASAGGALGDADSSLSGLAGARALSDDGRYVAFASFATTLAAGATNGMNQIYVKDLVSGEVVRASVDALGNAGNDNSSVPVISGNGRVVAFRSQSSNFSSQATSHTSQVFVRDLVAGTTTLESVTSDEQAFPMSPSTAPSVSADGRYVAFESQARLAAGDLDNGTWDVYLRDRLSGTTTFVSASANTTPGVHSQGASLSADGRFVGFHSSDAGLVPGDANGFQDVVLYDRTDATFTLVSLNDASQQANAASTSPSVSADGTLVLFASSASNLVTDPPSTGTQLYVRDLAANEPPVVLLGDDVVLEEGVALSRVASFTDVDASTSWTATVSWGDGTPAQPLALGADKSFTLAHLYAPGAYTLTVEVTDDAGATGADTLAVTVQNVAPTVSLPPSVELAFVSTLSLGGTFSDPGSGETFTATVDYGDGSGVQPLALRGGAFTLGHTYAAAGTYTVTVAVSDSNGGTGAAAVLVSVRMYSYAWLEPIAGMELWTDRLVPVKFTVRRADGSFLLDQGVRVEVLDGSGDVVVGPYTWSGQPSTGVVDNGNEYKVHVDTRGLPTGGYTLRVSFDSDQLHGEFSRNGLLSAQRGR